MQKQNLYLEMNPAPLVLTGLAVYLIATKGMWHSIALGLGLAFLTLGSLATLVYVSLRRMYNSITVVAPSKKIDDSKCSLFKAIPALRGKIAWANLADGASPLQRLEYMDPALEQPVGRILLKREDLLSTKYGGNKVRTNEFLVACAKELVERRGGYLCPVGAAGSNQLVATGVHAQLLDIPCKGFPTKPETPALDNGLNLLSMISLPSWSGALFAEGPYNKLKNMLSCIFDERSTLVMPGGNNVIGVLGQVGGFFELVDQVKDQNIQAPDHLFLALGSSCTTSGIVAGLALARTLGFKEWSKPIKIHAVPIHPMMQAFSGALPKKAIKKVSIDTVRLIASLGGPSDGEKYVEDIFANGELEMMCGYGSNYGGFTDAGLAAKLAVKQARLFRDLDDNEIVNDAPLPWMCSTFTSKSFAALMDFLRSNPSVKAESVLFYCSKSQVQPLGNCGKGPDFDKVWSEVTKMPEKGKKWLGESLNPKEEMEKRNIQTILAKRFQPL